MKISGKLQAVKEKTSYGLERIKNRSRQTLSAAKAGGSAIKDGFTKKIPADKLFLPVKNLKALSSTLVTYAIGPETKDGKEGFISRDVLETLVAVAVVGIPLAACVAGGVIVGTVALIGSGAESTGILGGMVGATVAGYSGYKVAKQIDKRYGH